MKQSQSTLGIREYMAILILMIGSKATEDTPGRLYAGVESAAWMLPILSGVFFFIPLLLLLKTLSVFQGKSLFDVIQNIMGKYIGSIICLVIFFMSSLTLSFDSRTYSNIVRSFYFTTTPTLVIHGIFLFVCAYGAKKGIQHIGSVAYLAVFYCVLALIISLLLSSQDTYIEAIFPIWGTGGLELLKESIFKVNLYADFLIVTLLIPYIASHKDFQKGTWISFIFVICLISLATLTYLCLFDRTLGTLGYPYHTMIRFISVGAFFGNVEILFLPIWLLGAFIRFTAILYLNTLLFGKIFKIEDFEYLIPSLATIYFLIGMIPETPFDLSLEVKPIVQRFDGLTFVAIPILLWLVALLKGDFKHDKKNSSL